MFRVHSQPPRSYRRAILALLALSCTSLAVTVWVMLDFIREQETVRHMMRLLPADSQPEALNLLDELRWQFRLSIIGVLNLVVSALAVVMLWRAYNTSQASLRDVRILASDILSSMDLAVITTDLTGLVTGINRRGIELLGSAASTQGQTLDEIAKPMALNDFRQRAMGHTGEDLTADFAYERGGIFRTYRAFCHPLRNHAGEVTGCILQLRDVTLRALMEDRLRRMERFMGLGSLAAGLHHEIKNPLAALSLHAQLLDESLEDYPVTQEHRENLSVIQTELARIGMVLESFRDFTSVATLNRVPTDILPLIRTQLSLVKPQTDQQGIRVQLDEASPAATAIDADPDRLSQVLLNLLLNAIEAMPHGGQISIRAFRTDGPPVPMLQIEIEDSGHGIPPELRQRIFDPYFTTKANGTGMGLALSEKIVRQHSGTLDVRCGEAGSTFVVSLPLICVPEPVSL